MPVYLARAGEDGPVKIGYADDPQRRLVDLQVGNHLRLSLLRLFEGGETEERILHIRFADLRLRGEWFSFSRAMLGDLGLTEIIEETAEVEPELDPLPTGDGRVLSATQIIKACGGIKVFIAELNVGANTVCMWRQDGIPGKYWFQILRVAQKHAPGLELSPEDLERHTANRKAA